METSPNPHGPGATRPQPEGTKPPPGVRIDEDQVVKFIRFWYPLVNQGHVTLTSIHPTDKSGTTTCSLSRDDEGTILAWIEREQNFFKRNVYFTPNGTKPGCVKKPAKSEITAAHCCLVDIDPLDDLFPLEEERVRLMAIVDKLRAMATPEAIRPAVIIDSGNGIQVLWHLIDVSNTESERYSNAIHKVFGMVGTFNFDRLLRLPGTINYPDATKIKKGRGISQARLLLSGANSYDAERIKEVAPALASWLASSGLLRKAARVASDGANEPSDEEYKQIWKDIGPHNPAAIRTLADLPESIRVRLEAMMDKANIATFHQGLYDRWFGDTKFSGVEKSTSELDFSVAGILFRSNKFERWEIALAVLAYPFGQVNNNNWAKAYEGDYSKHPDFYRLRAANRCGLRVGKENKGGKDESGDNVVKLVPKRDPEDWENLLKKDDKGRLVYSDVETALIIINHDDTFNGMFQFDQFELEGKIMRAPPLATPSSKEALGPYPRQLDDNDPVLVHAYFQRRWSRSFKHQGVIEKAISVAACGNSYHPVLDFLGNLAWDKTNRIDSWLTSAFGTEVSDYTRAIGAKLLIAAVRRLKHPGCKFDTVAVLEGSQGLRKTTALSSLFYTKWHTGLSTTDVRDKDTKMGMTGAWCVELAEIERYIKTENTTNNPIKEFFSTPVDRYRRPYAKTMSTVPRTTIMIGTTNHEDYLRDITGNRRYWPFKCLKCDIEWIEANRDQLWAEAVVREAANEPIHLDDKIEILANKEQESRLSEDPWMIAIEDFLYPTPPPGLKAALPPGKIFITNLVKGDPLYLPAREQNQASVRHVAAILRRLGWQQNDKRIDDGEGRFRRFWSEIPKKKR